MFVWATLDRVRSDVRATLFQRTANGHTVTYVNNRPTPLALPKANEPAVVIQDFQAVPKKRIVQSTDQVSFQNNTNLPCSITFNSIRPPGTLPGGDPTDFDLGEIQPGQVSRPFPRTAPGTATPTVVSQNQSAPKPIAWRGGEHVYTGNCGSIRITGVIQIPD